MDEQPRDTAINVRGNRRGNHGWTIQRHSNTRYRKQKGACMVGQHRDTAIKDREN